MATIADIGVPGQPLNSPPLTQWQAAVRDAITGSAARDVWTAWSPALTGFTASAVDARYARSRGGVVHINATFTVTAVTGSASFTLPVAALKDANGAAMLTAGGASFFGTVRSIPTGGSAYLDAYNSNGNYVGRASLSPIVPGTWVAGDKITCSLTYQCAPLP